MNDELTRDLNVLISIARLDALINARRMELNRLPLQLEQIGESLAKIDNREAESKSSLEEMVHERRHLEQGVEDNTARVVKYKTQLMEVKTNKEYTAMLHEISHVEKDTEEKEERLLMLMDEIDQRSGESKDLLDETSDERKRLQTKKSGIEARIGALEADVADLESQKPKLLSELKPQMKKRYDRLLEKYGDCAVAHIEDDSCQGCHTRIPAQRAVEVKKNDHLILCEACGRILVYYDA